MFYLLFVFFFWLLCTSLEFVNFVFIEYFKKLDVYERVSEMKAIATV